MVQDFSRSPKPDRMLFVNARQYMIHIDRPTEPLIPQLTQFAGWIRTHSEARSEYSFSLNNAVQTNVKFYEREDVPREEGMKVIGWSFVCETSLIATNEHGSLTFRLLKDGQTIFRRYFKSNAIVNPMDVPLVLMMHVPKSAGTSLRVEMERIYKPEDILCIYDDPAFISMSELAKLSETAFDRLKMVYGHFSYGIHKHTSKRFRYATILRPPFEFIESYLFFMKYQKRHHSFAESDIVEILRSSQTIELDNCYTRYFCGRLDGEPVSEQDLKKAIENVKRDFVLVGTMEYLNASVDAISEYLGDAISISHANETSYIEERRFLDVAKFRREAAPRIKYDLLLYDFVLDHFWGSGQIAQTTAV